MNDRYAYIAAVMDCEGSFHISRVLDSRKRIKERKLEKKYNYAAWASVKIMQKDIIDFIYDTFKSGSIGMTIPRPERPGSAEQYNWCLTQKEDLAYFLEKLIPFLIVKKERAKFLIEYCKNDVIIPKSRQVFGLTEEERAYRESSYQKMRKLNGNKDSL